MLTLIRSRRLRSRTSSKSEWNWKQSTGKTRSCCVRRRSAQWTETRSTWCSTGGKERLTTGVVMTHAICFQLGGVLALVTRSNRLDAKVTLDITYNIASVLLVAILNFQKVLFLTPDVTYIAHICQHLKFCANWSRIGRYMPFCVFSKTAAAAILNFQKVTFWTPEDTCIDRIYKHTKFGANR